MEKGSARILSSYYRPKPGGLCTRLFRCVNALLQRGYEVHYLAVVPFPIEHRNCHFHRFPWPAERTDSLLFWGFFHLLAPFMLTTIGIRHRITHTFSFSTSYALLLQPLRLIKSVPLVLFLRADAIENHRIKKRPGWLIKFETLLEALAIHGVALYGVSQVLVDTVQARHRYFRPLCSGVMRNDIPGLAQARPDNILPIMFACVGVLEQRKNQALAIRCMQKLDGEKCHLLIYGEGPDREFLTGLALSCGVADKVSMNGWCERNRLWPEIDVLLLPSLHEGASNSLLEALARGLPVLAGDLDENREILPENWLLPVAETDAWTLAMQTLVDDPKARIRSITAEQRAYAQRLVFDWEAHISELINAN